MANRSERVRRYFDAQANSYAQRSGGFLWNGIRKIEQRAIFKLLAPRRGERILDAGSGSGHYSELLLKAGAEVTALDFSQEMLQNLQARLPAIRNTITADLTDCNIPAEFDKVLCAGALEFVSDPTAAITNLLKALDPAGPRLLVLHAPADTLLARIYRGYHRRHGFEVHLFSKKTLDSLAAQTPGYVIAKETRVMFNRIVLIRPMESTA